MLYRYQYIKRHPLHGLNKHLLFFFRGIRVVRNNTPFKTNGNYFHPEFSSILSSSPELTKKFKTFFNSYKRLDTEQRQVFYNKVTKSQCIRCVFEDTSVDCTDINNDSIRLLIGDNSLYELMKYLYENTIRSTRWKIDDHYKQMYNSMLATVCPFCGIEIMHQTFREDYDHLLPKSRYPLTAINLYNLAPMCSTCNKKAKGEVDVLYKDGVRRSFAYPYTTELNVELEFTGSIIPQTDINNESGVWFLTINPQEEKNTTWFEVFKIERRYIDDYMKFFDSWTLDFIDSLIRINQEIKDAEQLKIELSLTAKLYKRRRFSNYNIIKAPLFDYLANCNNQIFYNSLLRKYRELKIEMA